jgi:hypothetical protein
MYIYIYSIHVYIYIASMYIYIASMFIIFNHDMGVCLYGFPADSASLLSSKERKRYCDVREQGVVS